MAEEETREQIEEIVNNNEGPVTEEIKEEVKEEGSNLKQSQNRNQEPNQKIK